MLSGNNDAIKNRKTMGRVSGRRQALISQLCSGQASLEEEEAASGLKKGIPGRERCTGKGPEAARAGEFEE